MGNSNVARGLETAMKDFITPAERIGDEVLTDDAYLRTERARAIDWLGLRWRGRTPCTHRYTAADGRTVREIYPTRDAPGGMLTVIQCSERKELKRKKK